MDTCAICLDDLPEIKCQYCSLKIHKQCYLDYNKTECPQCKKFLIKPKTKDKIKKKINNFVKKMPYSLFDLIITIICLLIFIPTYILACSCIFIRNLLDKCIIQ